VGVDEADASVARHRSASRLEMPRPVCCQNCLAVLDLSCGNSTRKMQRRSEMQCCTTRERTSRADRKARHASADLREGKSREVSERVPNFCSKCTESYVRHCVRGSDGRKQPPTFLMSSCMKKRGYPDCIASRTRASPSSYATLSANFGSDTEIACSVKAGIELPTGISEGAIGSEEGGGSRCRRNF
jgi:hypothetical protein